MVAGGSKPTDCMAVAPLGGFHKERPQNVFGLLDSLCPYFHYCFTAKIGNFWTPSPLDMRTYVMEAPLRTKDTTNLSPPSPSDRPTPRKEGVKRRREAFSPSACLLAKPQTKGFILAKQRAAI